MGRMLAGLTGAVVMLVAELAGAVEQEMPQRSFDRFAFDTNTAQGIWVELQGFLDTKSGVRSLDTSPFRNRPSPFDDRPKANGLDVTMMRGVFAIGGDSVEAGLIIPYRFVDDICGETPDRNDIGDIRAYFKYVPVQTEWVDVGMGYDISFESGDPDESFGFGQVGHLPFATSTLHLGPADVNAHLGFRFLRSGRPEATESLVYGAGLHIPLLSNVAARAELTGQTFDLPGDLGGDFDALTIQPGFDILLPIDGADVILRPSGSIGLNDDTSDWGAGGSIAIRFRLGG